MLATCDVISRLQPVQQLRGGRGRDVEILRDLAGSGNILLVLAHQEIVQGPHVSLVELHVFRGCLAHLSFHLPQLAKSSHEPGDLGDVHIGETFKIDEFALAQLTAGKWELVD